MLEIQQFLWLTSWALNDAADEDRTLARLRALFGAIDRLDYRSAVWPRRQRTGDGALSSFERRRSGRCAIEVQNGWWSAMRGCRREVYRLSHRHRSRRHCRGKRRRSHGDGVNIAARLEGIENLARSVFGGRLSASESAAQLAVSDLGDVSTLEHCRPNSGRRP